MKIYHIAAISENHVIGKDNTLPWHIPDDLKRFSKITRGHPIIMGSKTFKSMGSIPLARRTNIVVSRSNVIVYDHKPLSYEGKPYIEAREGDTALVFVRSIEDALAYCGGQHEVYIIGGGSLYQQTVHLTDELRLTIVHQEIEEDATCVYYPEIDEEEWVLSFVESSDTHSYVDYVRRVP